MSILLRPFERCANLSPPRAPRSRTTTVAGTAEWLSRWAPASVAPAAFRCHSAAPKGTPRRGHASPPTHCAGGNDFAATQQQHRALWRRSRRVPPPSAGRNDRAWPRGRLAHGLAWRWHVLQVDVSGVYQDQSEPDEVHSNFPRLGRRCMGGLRLQFHAVLPLATSCSPCAVMRHFPDRHRSGEPANPGARFRRHSRDGQHG